MRYSAGNTTMSDLRYEYRAWLNENDLPKMSAENLLRQKGLTRDQKEYLKAFIVRWVSTGE
jgi:hypothetical protein